MTNPLWYRSASVYQIDPSRFWDSDGDGWGDLPGVTARLDHVRGLGATCVWLLPFYASPFRDGGYDVSDHLAVDPRLGDMADVAALLQRADELGLRVLVELVAQHTSDQHRWFQEARHDRRSPYRDYYIWADEPEPTEVSPIFPTVEDSVWAWDGEAQQFYRHVFYSHEPDLALDNPRVRAEMHRIMTFWLRLGVSGFRVDAVPSMVERARAARPDTDGHWLLRDMRAHAWSQQPEAVLLGEVDVEPKQYADYFGDGDRMTMLLNFWANNHLFLALARGDARPLADALRAQPVPPSHASYAHWLRNNDELDLERLSAQERDEVLAAFAPQEEHQAYGRGVRRRLAPMLGGDPRRIALVHALLLSLPGPPVLRYGDEIGMGDDLSQPERLAVRAPMQWSDGVNAGFSAAPAERLVAPVITGGRFGYETVNVYGQTLHGDSLLSLVGNMVRTRSGLREIDPHGMTLLDVGAPSVFAVRYADERTSVVMLANLSDQAVTARLEGDGLGGLVDILADHDYAEAAGGPPLSLELAGYGYRWLRPRDRFFG